MFRLGAYERNLPRRVNMGVVMGQTPREHAGDHS